jgi:hypothetical protein
MKTGSERFEKASSKTMILHLEAKNLYITDSTGVIILLSVTFGGIQVNETTFY